MLKMACLSPRPWVKSSAAFIIAVGCSVLVGWVFEIERLKSMLAGMPTMKANTAACFVLLGSALWLVCDVRSRGHRVANWLAALAIVIATLTLLEHATDINLGVDQLLIRDHDSVPGAPGRMSPVASLCFLLASVSLLLLGMAGSAAHNWAFWLTLPLFPISVMALVGYAYGAYSSSPGPFVFVALPAGVMFFLLSLSLLAINAEQRVMRLLVSNTAGGYVARVLLPFILLCMFAIGWLCLLGQEAGFYNARYGLALMVLFCSAVTVLITLWLARQLHQADLERERYVKLLEQSNQDLQRFAYIASHDLQTPLRSVVGFVQLLEADYKERLDRHAYEWINRIILGTRQMQNLIHDLLAYSRVESESRPREAVALDEVVAEVLLSYEALLHETGAEVSYAGLPVVHGYRVQLLQLLQNLIGNALKFRSDQRPRISITASPGTREVSIFVIDNGIGIEPKNHSKIFDIFLRLHNQQEYTGTGIGLAICKRVVQRHGGRIWVESAPGHGSTFCFTLPTEAGAP